jgi:hypothetical protein
MSNSGTDKSPEIYEIVAKEMKSLELLKFYPYGKCVNYTPALGGNVNLKKLDANKQYSYLTDSGLVLSKMKEATRAVKYTCVDSLSSEPYFTKQKITSLAIMDLLLKGVCGWSKKHLSGLSPEEISNLQDAHNKKLEMIRVQGRYADSHERKFKQCRVEPFKQYKTNTRNVYGVFRVIHMPLLDHRSRPLYTRQELCAILYMVYFSF